ncbi:MAG: hypothetical protein ACKOJF_14580, partial [Planctomycetaceae bacterium]
MLCIAVAPESRRLGKVDLFNAAPQCDLIEFRLDRLGKEPDLKEMLEGISKPSSACAGAGRMAGTGPTA